MSLVLDGTTTKSGFFSVIGRLLNRSNASCSTTRTRGLEDNRRGGERFAGLANEIPLIRYGSKFSAPARLEF